RRQGRGLTGHGDEDCQVDHRSVRGAPLRGVSIRAAPDKSAALRGGRRGGSLRAVNLSRIITLPRRDQQKATIALHQKPPRLLVSSRRLWSSSRDECQQRTDESRRLINLTG